MLTIYLFYRKIGILTTKGQSLKALFVILAGTFVFGFMWEIFEFFVQGSTNGNLANIVDSVSDICFDLAGGIFASLMYAQTNAMITNSNETYVQKA